MSQTIQIKRGLKADLPILAEGEMGLCTDTRELYIGNGTTNTIVNASTSYIHNQLLASSEWIIRHNLNKYPNVTVVDSGGSVVLGEISYISENEIKISFQGAFSGKAYLN